MGNYRTFLAKCAGFRAAQPPPALSRANVSAVLSIAMIRSIACYGCPAICNNKLVALRAYGDKFPEKQLHRLKLAFVGNVELQSKSFAILFRR
jgi:hypothetical protein